MTADQIELDRGSQLCVSCGLCCSGALHDAAALLPAEMSLALSLGMKVTQSGDDVRFSLPCHLLQNRCCTVYAHRPSPCRNYKCGLLRSLDAGDRTLAECLDKVDTARKLLGDLQATLPPGVTIAEARAAMVAASGNEGVGRIEQARIKLHAFALNLHLEKYFRNDYENSFVQSVPIDEDSE